MTIEQLVEAGFSRDGEWWSDDAGKVFCKGSIPKKPGVYLFVVGVEIRYVGSAIRTLRSRIKSYERRQRDGRSNRPVHVALTETVESGKRVEVYTYQIDPSESTDWRDLPVSVIFGVEAALMAELNPVWNRRGRTLLLDSRSVNGPEESDAPER